MKKFVMGIIVGAMLMFSTQIFADVRDFVGKRVGSVMKVTLDGQELGQAIVVDSTSHLPVRALATALGVEVNYMEDTREIHLVSKQSEESTLLRKKLEVELEIIKTANVINNYDSALSYLQSVARSSFDEQKKEEAAEKIKQLDEDYEAAIKRLPELEKQLQAIEKELTELNK